MSKKRRVFHVARELSISNEAVIDYLSKHDKSVKSQMSAVSEELYEEICKQYNKGMAVAEPGQQDFRQQLKEKQILEEMRRTKAREELEERIRFATKLAEERPQKIAEAKREAEELKKKVAHAFDEKPVEGTEEEPSMVDIISKAKKKIDLEKKTHDDTPDAVAQPIGDKVSAETPAPAPKLPTKPSAKGEKAKEKGAKAEVPAESVGKAGGAADKPAEPVVGKKEVVRKDGKAKSSEKSEQTKKPETSGDKKLGKGKRKGKKKKKREISEAEIQASIKKTFASMEEVKSKRRHKKSKDADGELEEEETSVLKVSEFISVAELADYMEVEPADVIRACLELGMMVSINQRLDMVAIEAVADEFGFTVEKIQEYGSEILDKYQETDEDLKLAVGRSPVVTIMGHVDHGKTSLLDFIRKSSIISGEAGGITQHIGAYSVSVGERLITFLDTPGHEAFTAMRARGAQVTDIVILIVAADDGVRPQTIEAINHALAASVPIVVAINKIDKPGVNPDAVKQQLSDHGVLVEEWGGKYQCLNLSAKTGEGVERLLELILLEAEMLELKANPDRHARGIIIESRLDKGKGPVGTVLIQSGTLKVGDLFVAGNFSGKVRAMYNERKKKIRTAPPATPVQVIGFDGVPQAGDSFVVMDNEREVREISNKRKQLKREQDFRRQHHLTLDQISQQIKHGQVKELNVILKADVDGSNEALSDALMKLSTDEVSVNVIHKAVGGISESDVLLASASQAVIIGFNVRPTVQARELAKKEEIDIRLYDIIYAVVEDVRSALEGMLEPEVTDELTATIEVRETFKVPKVGTIAGSYVVSGKASRSDLTRVYRDDKLIHETKISSLKRFKEDVREVASGFECGLGLEGFDDIKVGDIIETYKKVETARKLS